MEGSSVRNEEQLHGRLERLARDELDLRERIGYRVAELKGNGLWVRDDAACQRLSDELRRVRMELEEARATFLGVPAPSASAVFPRNHTHRNAIMHYDYPIEVLAKSAKTSFQLGFARQTARLMPQFKDAILEPANDGLLILGTDESALSIPVETIRQMHGEAITIGGPRVRYLFDRVFHEPIMWVRVGLMPQFVESVVLDLVDRGAGMEEIDCALVRPVVKARAPLQRLLGYPRDIGTLSENTAELLMWVSHYEPMPPQPPVAGRAA